MPRWRGRLSDLRAHGRKPYGEHLQQVGRRLRVSRSRDGSRARSADRGVHPCDPPCRQPAPRAHQFRGTASGTGRPAPALGSARLLLTGPGGVGKTRLALRAGRENGRPYPDGVWFVELASVQDPALVPQAVFTALGLQDHSSNWALAHVGRIPRRQAATPDPRQLRARARGGRRPRGDAAARLPRRPDPRHQPPGARGDRRGRDRRADAGPARGWAMPRRRRSSVRRGRAVRGARERRRARIRGRCRRIPPPILSICTHVDGIPLALELAAVRLNALGPRRAGSRARGPARSARYGDRSASLRQQTLEGAIDSLTSSLREPERRLWARLSVFAGGFELEAAQAVCGATASTRRRSRTSSVPGRNRSSGDDRKRAARFRLLEPLRQFGRDRFREADVARELRARHADWVAVLPRR